MRLLTTDWEVADIKPGRRLQKPDCGITGAYAIGYIHRKHGQVDHAFGLISLADGMFQTFGDGTRQSLADYFNTVGHLIPVEMLGTCK